MLRSKVSSRVATAPWTSIKRTVACSPFNTTEEDHDPSLPAHTRRRGGRLRVQLLHVNGPRPHTDLQNAQR